MSQKHRKETLGNEHNEKQPLTTADFRDEILEVEELIAREMWDVV